MTPQQRLQKEGLRVLMVGDGINDAPALVQADLSMAVHSGSHLGKDVADITLMRSDPRQVIEFFDLAERINLKISQNLILSLLYNTISIPIAMSGLLNPLIAVSAMLLSSLTVIGNTLLMIKKNLVRQLQNNVIPDPKLKKQIVNLQAMIGTLVVATGILFFV